MTEGEIKCGIVKDYCEYIIKIEDWLKVIKIESEHECGIAKDYVSI